ncbi:MULTISPECIES: hypothetical protein [unclassified Aureimonas]|uniref:hypothetical protein n=1 Tax=unclassified Aureimonas TaxID=2615206 RepID=UPI0006F92845|nr:MULTISPECIES: hypothetical protein [unclassified Aureimonas]KQT66034.1 hypothetical protein ASG62_21220 [Aureimonas sp. Leaf427]KQT73392.1 hypothetical protein ASG54_17700 [Aureimonas sp. Leaf460]
MTDEGTARVGREMKADPASKAARIEACVRSNPMIGHNGWLFAREVKMKPGPEAVRTLCTRVANGFISGRINASDFDRLRATGSPPPRLMDVMLGR